MRMPQPAVSAFVVVTVLIALLPGTVHLTTTQNPGTTSVDWMPWGSSDAMAAGHTGWFDPVTPGGLPVISDVESWTSPTNEAIWTTSSLPGPISSIVVSHHDSDSLFVATDGFGIYRSQDGGFTWTARNDGLPGLPGVLVMHPTNPDILYTLVGSALYRTLDGAQTWHPLDTLPETKDGLAVCPASPDSLYMWSNTRIYYSEDLGESWEVIRERISGESAYLELAVDPQSPTTIYYGTYTAGMFKTVDGGANWVQVLGGSNGEVREISIDPADSQLVYVTTLERPAPFYGATHVYRTTDGGLTWSTVDTGLPVDGSGDLFETIHIAIAPSSQDVFAQVQNQGIWRGTKVSDNWSPTGLPTQGHGHSLIIHNGKLYTSVGTALFQSQDRGDSWLGAGLPFWGYIMNRPSDPASGLARAHCRESCGGGLFRTDDAGRTWTISMKDWPITHLERFPVGGTAPEVLYVSGGHFARYGVSPLIEGVYRTTDGGTTWQALLAEIPAYLGVSPSDGYTAYMYTDAGEFLRSIDGGVNWQNAAGPDWPGNPSYFDISSKNPDTVVMATGNSLYVTTDGGTTWHFLNAFESEPRVFAVMFAPSDDAVLYAVTGFNYAQYLYRSQDAGSTWSRITPAACSLSALIVDPDDVRVIYVAGSLPTGGSCRGAVTIGTCSGDTCAWDRLTEGWPDNRGLDVWLGLMPVTPRVVLAVTYPFGGGPYQLWRYQLPPIYSLTVNKTGTGSGTVTSNPAGIDCGADCSETYTHGTVVTLTATADVGSTFVGWSDAGCSGTDTCVVTMDAPKNVTVTFSTYRLYLPLVLRAQWSAKMW